ncbi:glycosyltransferase family 4 protein [Streptomyces griseoincarnatus]
MLHIDTAVQFFPRGGSAQVIRYLGKDLADRGHVPRILCGSLGHDGELSHAATFYQGLPVASMDYTPAAAAYHGDTSSMDGQRHPFHPSYEDRGPAAPDRMFTAVRPATIGHLADAWASFLAQNRSPRPDVVHLHHLSHLQPAVKRAYPGIPVVTTFHGTDLKLLDKAQQVTHLARRLGLPLADISRRVRGDEQSRATALGELMAGKYLSEQDRDLLRTIDWQQWLHADHWSQAMERYAHLAGRLVVVSESDQHEVRRLLGIPEEEVTVVPNGVDTSHFTQRDFTDEQRLSLLRRWLVAEPRGWAPGGAPGSIRYSDGDLARIRSAGGGLRPVLLWVGRFQRVKRLEVLLEAFARILTQTGIAPVLLIWGGFPGEAEGEHPLELARRLGVDQDVFFIGWRGHDELPDGMNCADLMVAPAVNESFGMVYIEAQACGTPPVATNTGGPATLITSRGAGADGWTVKPDDIEDLATTLAAALADPGERERRAANGVDRTHRLFSWQAVADRYDDIYQVEARRPA